MLRRKFLTTLSGLTLLPCTNVVSAVERASNRNHTNRLRDRKQLILIELKGGNDGLNTIVPYSDHHYYRLRSDTAIRRDSVFQLTPELGLNPELQALMPVWQQNNLAIILGVGYPEQNQSHFKGLKLWETASGPRQDFHDGWLYRLFTENRYQPGAIAHGIVIGGSEELFTGDKSNHLVINDIENFISQAKFLPKRDSLSNKYSVGDIASTSQRILRFASKLERNRSRSTLPRNDFPATKFGKQVHTTSELIASLQNFSVLKLYLDGFDTHFGQPARHKALLSDFSTGFHSLVNTLKKTNRWDSTLIVTYSEFGRRPKENGNAGTDHGTSAPMFVAGGLIKGGLYGQQPALNRLVDQNLTHTVDYRSVFKTISANWWGFDHHALPNEKYELLDFIRTT